MANPDYGYCNCPVCSYDRAAVRIAANNKAYISCDGCVSNIRTLSSVGDRAIRALLTSRADGAPTDKPAPAAAPATRPPAQSPAAAAAAAPAAADKPEKKRGGFADALELLGGGK